VEVGGGDGRESGRAGGRAEREKKPREVEGRRE
jgi:hypothetical protein